MIETQDFLKIKKNLIENDVLTKQITLDKIDVSENGIKEKYIKVEGNIVAVSSGFFPKMAKLINVNTKLASSFIKNDDQELYALLIKAIKQYKTIKTGATLDNYLLIADPVDHTVIDIVKGKSGGRLSMSSICDITEKILNDNSHMSLESAGIHKGNASFNFINNNSIAFPDAGPDEEFKFGFSINTTPTTTKMSLYNQRLICSNGMRVNMGSGQIANAVNVADSFSLRSLSTGNLERFFNQIKTLNAQGFVPPSFKDALLRTQSTKASFAELESMVGIIMQQFPDQESAKDYKKLLDNYFPSFRAAVERAGKKGLNVYDMNQNQKSNIKTGMSIWDVVNNLTFLGSNNSEFDIIEKESLKAHGGHLFNKALTTGLDLQYANLQTI